MDGRRIGELAAATGLTVRTLHHYDHIGLLVASDRTASGHRLYSDADVARLYRICVLRALGLPLADIRRAVDAQRDDSAELPATLTRHLADLDARAQAAARLRERLAVMLAGFGDGEHRDGQETEQLVDVLGEMSALERPDFFLRPVSLVVYADVAAAHRFLVDVFALGEGPLTLGPAGVAVHGEVLAGDGLVWLHPEQDRWGLASPRRLGAVTGGIVVLVDDVDAHFRHAQERGARIDYEPVDQPYGYREYSARDPEGGLWSFMKPSAPIQEDT
jgi:DNA-binding transcriptional MerR regulator/uncharacterized glyoxalase superfamily protein PhnB